MEISPFRERREHELYDLPDEDLIGYVRGAVAAGRHDAVKYALGVLVFRYLDIVQARVRLRIPKEDVDDVAARVIEDATVSTFDGHAVGQFRSWLNTITDRRVADYHRARENKPGTDPLPTEHLGDEEVWGGEPSAEFEGSAEDARRALAEAREDLSPDHRKVIDAYVFGRASAREAAAVADGMSEANVHQIASRFERRIRGALEGDTG